ncbi:MAG: (2Fe-2S) ferredoxin domain-containing protein [Deltaproteobacteria bacterium]|nr:(2Fe-2S) ferredoxin domain-containing protein [Deltaproteobacteria bacterium]
MMEELSSTFPVHVLVCENERPEGKPCCKLVGGSELIQFLKGQVQESGLGKFIRVTRTGCLGYCNTVGCTVVIYRKNEKPQWYTKVTQSDYSTIWEKLKAPADSRLSNLPKTLLFFLISATLLFAKESETLSPPPPPVPVMEIFAVDKNPGSGSLQYSENGKTRNLVLGEQTGYYGVGLVFNGNGLPVSYRSQFRSQNLIQLVFGIQESKRLGRVPQFGAVTILTAQFPTSTRSYKLLIPSLKEKGPAELGILLFSSPESQLTRSDEDRLKSNFFAKSGFINVEPFGASRTVTVQSRGKKFSFRMQRMKFGINATLVTPFSPGENKLKGTVQFPIYLPQGADAEALVAKIASESFQGSILPIPPPGAREQAGQ